MSESNPPTGATAPNLTRSPKRDRNWPALRLEYETGSISQRGLADKHGIPQNTVMMRAIREKWVQNAKLVRRTAASIEAEIDNKVRAKVADELAPWIEKQKTKYTKRTFRLAARGLGRVERIFSTETNPNSRTEANIAKAAETYTKLGRVALGMSDGSGSASAISVNLRSDQAAVQFVS